MVTGGSRNEKLKTGNWKVSLQHSSFEFSASSFQLLFLSFQLTGSLCRLRGLARAGFRRGLFTAGHGLRAELLGEALDAAFGVDQLLPAGEERVTVRADF